MNASIKIIYESELLISKAGKPYKKILAVIVINDGDDKIEFVKEFIYNK